MKDFLKFILIEPFLDNEWFSWILGMFSWAVIISVFWLLMLLGLWAIDSSFLPLKEKEGVVTRKYIVPSHTTTTYMTSGKVMIPMTTFHNTTYNIEITIDGLTDCVSLYRDHFNEITVGQTICCRYTTGRICESIYIKSFCEH